HVAPISVCVVSFHPLVFPAIQELLAEPDFHLAECRPHLDPLPDNPGAAIPAASVYLVESHPRPVSTAAAIERVSSVIESPHLLVLGEQFDEESAFLFLRLKVKGLVTFAQAFDQLRRAVEAVACGGFWVPRALLARFVDVAVSTAGRPGPPAASAADLTSRERQVLDGLMENLSNKEIASRLGISERGVKFHVSNLLSKYRVRRRSDLVLLFLNSA
ncbi:MAG: LuxR C-terminal-related transcriptional regulator, partial [Acidobacteriota bacterium]